MVLGVNTAGVGVDVECTCHGGSNVYTNMLRELRLPIYISHSERTAFLTLLHLVSRLIQRHC